MSNDPFSVLGLEPRFDLDPAELERAYFALSASLHPDVAAGDDEAQRRMAILNDARETLADPERRADALLIRVGGPRGSEEKSLPPAFLMEIMEVREAVEMASAEKDPSKRRQELARWTSWAEAQRQEAIQDIQAMFHDSGSQPSLEGLRAIRQRLNAWRYIERLIEQIEM